LVDLLKEVKKLVEQKEEVAISKSLKGCLSADCLHLSWDKSPWRALGHEIISHAMLYSVGNYLIR
jgi:hypothetical protein